MRYVDADEVRVRVPPDWRVKAAEAVAELVSASEGDRQGFLIRFAPIWRT